MAKDLGALVRTLIITSTLAASIALTCKGISELSMSAKYHNKGYEIEAVEKRNYGIKLCLGGMACLVASAVTGYYSVRKPKENSHY